MLLFRLGLLCRSPAFFVVFYFSLIFFGLVFSSLLRQVLLALHLQGGRINDLGLVGGVQLVNHPGPASSVIGMRVTLAFGTSRDNQDERGSFHHLATRTLRTPWRAREAGSKT